MYSIESYALYRNDKIKVCEVADFFLMQLHEKNGLQFEVIDSALRYDLKYNCSAVLIFE